MKHSEELSLNRLMTELLKRHSAEALLQAIASAMRIRTDVLNLGGQTCAEAEWMRSADSVKDLAVRLPRRLRMQP